MLPVCHPIPGQTRCRLSIHNVQGSILIGSIFLSPTERMLSKPEIIVWPEFSRKTCVTTKEMPAEEKDDISGTTSYLPTCCWILYLLPGQMEQMEAACPRWGYGHGQTAQFFHLLSLLYEQGTKKTPEKPPKAVIDQLAFGKGLPLYRSAYWPACPCYEQHSRGFFAT